MLFLSDLWATTTAFFTAASFNFANRAFDVSKTSFCTTISLPTNRTLKDYGKVIKRMIVAVTLNYGINYSRNCPWAL